MAVKIPIQIAQRNFEIIRDRIGMILADELGAQTETENFEVYLERLISFSDARIPCVNVLFHKANFDSYSQTSKHSDLTFYIDVYYSTPSTPTERGDELARKKIEKAAGIIDYILSSQEYRTLDFAPGLIMNRMVRSISTGNQTTSNDTTNLAFARIELEVKSSECVGLIEPVDLGGYDARFTINETSKGYKITINNI